MRSRLFLKIYLTILGSIAILAITGIAVVSILIGANEDRGTFAEHAALIAAALPEGADPALLQTMLDRLGPASGGELAVLDVNGSMLAQFQPPIPIARRFDPVLVPLPDGRVLSIRLEPPFGPPRGNPLIPLAVVSGLVALIAWPVVRHLTRRLEKLRFSVEAWGAGDLGARAPILGSDEIAVVAESFNHAAERVETMIAANRALLANASHELRSPLARLRLGVELFETDPSPARREEIDRNLGELDELVGEILLSSQLSHAGMSEPWQRVDLLALVAEEAAQAGLAVTGISAEVLGAPRLLDRLARNLIQNALRHGLPPVEIEVGLGEAQVELAVRDHGAGVPEPDMSRVFDPFYRPGGHGEAAGGWGLGLALVRQIAEGHGGSVRVETPADGGARFVVTLPQADAGQRVKDRP
ncbi:MAG TPA: HAMP domain-containing sensor histidine kinase [Pelagibacterium sp.]|uniref:sensor histidine kinase n=1 Tax=Pelagibacterium sp. TaxID=1967288 RepID=UPI002BE06073|nr:HAMP domain-containing sensor histidine kinase [Pelagibacterium sp.]HWJ87716.1 HAMP domain-containing sensor histidine kinase [Pelagibacterium sp.]